MADQALKDELNRSLESRFKRKSTYDSVAVLAVYWKECTDKGYKDEARRVKELFAQDFGYSAEEYEIPSTRCEVHLSQRITSFILENDRPETLFIIHYGGHGSPDDDRDQSQESVWCAEPNESSPNLKWSNIQPLFGNHRSEVIVLLDCCYGAQAARTGRARRLSPIPPNVELFAACGLGEKTVRPGPHSFTSLLIAELRDQLQSQQYATIALAHKNMASKESKLGQSAVYFPLEDNNRTIRLESLRQTSAPVVATAASEAASVTLQLSMGDSDRKAFEEVIVWLKKNPPRTVSAVVVDKIITSATAVYKYTTDQEYASRSITGFGALPEPAKKDIRSNWNDFNTTVAGLATSLRKPRAPSALVSDDELSGDIVHGLDEAVKPVHSAIERNVMSLPQLNNEDVLLTTTDDKLLEDLGFGYLLRSRLASRLNAGDGRPSAVTNSRLASHKTPPLSRFMNGFLTSDQVALGRIVLDTTNPGRNFCKAATLTLGEADRSRNEFTNVYSLTNARASTGFRAALRTLLDVVARKSGASVDAIETARAVTYELLNVDDVFARLLAEEAVQKWVETYKKRARVYMVAALHTVQDVTVSLDHDRGAATGAKTTSLASESSASSSATTLPSAFEADLSHRAARAASFAAPGERIIAVGYLEVKLRSYFSSKTTEEPKLAKKVVWKSFDASRTAEAAGMVEVTVERMQPTDLGKGAEALVESAGSMGQFVILKDQ